MNAAIDFPHFNYFCLSAYSFIHFYECCIRVFVEMGFPSALSGKASVQMAGALGVA
jgi:hypothetical protein